MSITSLAWKINHFLCFAPFGHPYVIDGRNSWWGGIWNPVRMWVLRMVGGKIFSLCFYFHSIFFLRFYKFLHGPRTFVSLSFNYSSVLRELKHHQAPFPFPFPRVRTLRKQRSELTQSKSKRLSTKMSPLFMTTLREIFFHRDLRFDFPSTQCKLINFIR